MTCLTVIFCLNRKLGIRLSINRLCVNILEKFTEFEKKFREKYPTFDGHLYLHDLNHFTAYESKIIDSYGDFEDFEDEDDYDEGDEWKTNN